jgi:hypothetical protein
MHMLGDMLRPPGARCETQHAHAHANACAQACARTVRSRARVRTHCTYVRASVRAHAHIHTCALTRLLTHDVGGGCTASGSKAPGTFRNVMFTRKVPSTARSPSAVSCSLMLSCSCPGFETITRSCTQSCNASKRLRITNQYKVNPACSGRVHLACDQLRLDGSRLLAGAPVVARPGLRAESVPSHAATCDSARVRADAAGPRVAHGRQPTEARGAALRPGVGRDDANHGAERRVERRVDDAEAPVRDVRANGEPGR